jgi:hypothetical protein
MRNFDLFFNNFNNSPEIKKSISGCGKPRGLNNIFGSFSMIFGCANRSGPEIKIHLRCIKTNEFVIFFGCF